MAEKTRLYTIPLRREFQKASLKRKSNKAVKAVKEFVAKHMKVETVSIGEELNELIWKNGITNPPAKVKVEITMEENGAFVNLVGYKRKKVEAKGTGVLGKQNMKDKLAGAVEDLKGKGKEEAPEDEKKVETKPKKDESPKADKIEETPKEESKPKLEKTEAKKETPKAEEPKAQKEEKTESPKEAKPEGPKKAE